MNDILSSMRKNYPLAILLMGPTASGKTDLAMELYRYLPIRIISVDSVLIYKGMNIGTAKPNKEELNNIPHYMINILDPSEYYSVANFYYDVVPIMEKITKSDLIPVLVGGSMLYFKVLIEGISSLPPANLKIRSYIRNQAKILGSSKLHSQLKKIDPISANRIHPNDLYRISRLLEVFFVSGKTFTELIKSSHKKLPYQLCQFAILPVEKEILKNRIVERFHKMLNSGFQQEVCELFNRGDLNKDMPSMRSIGYRQMWSYLDGEISYNEMIFHSIQATYKLVKNQITWLKRWKNNTFCLRDNNNLSINVNKILKIVKLFRNKLKNKSLNIY